MRKKNGCGRFWSAKRAGVALLVSLAVAATAGAGPASAAADGITPIVTAGVSVNTSQLPIPPNNTGCCA